jgi:hypothetical protein
MGEWRCISIFLELITRWSCEFHASAALTTPPPPRKSVLGTHWIGDWLGLGVGLDAVENRKILHCRESNPGRPACRSSLYGLSLHREV